MELGREQRVIAIVEHPTGAHPDGLIDLIASAVTTVLPGNRVTPTVECIDWQHQQRATSL